MVTCWLLLSNLPIPTILPVCSVQSPMGIKYVLDSFIVQCQHQESKGPDILQNGQRLALSSFYTDTWCIGSTCTVQVVVNSVNQICLRRPLCTWVDIYTQEALNFAKNIDSIMIITIALPPALL